ncbi:MAG: F0F1 ATP synthase subunit B [Chthoniobacteraceae bacterium]
MLIDWFTVGAQALNFLILVWLMKRFLYQPILHAIEEREKRVASQLSEAETKKTEAMAERAEFQRKNEEIDRQRDSLLQKATEESAVKRESLITAARAEAEALRVKLERVLAESRETLNREVASRAQKEVFAIARKVLTDLAGASLEERIADVFVGRLRALDAAEKATLVSVIKTSGRSVVICTAFDLPDAQRKAVEQAVRETLAPDAHVEFSTAPDLVSGIELITDGHKVAWSIAEYLTSLEHAVTCLLDGQRSPTPAQPASAHAA